MQAQPCSCLHVERARSEWELNCWPRVKLVYMESYAHKKSKVPCGGDLKSAVCCVGQSEWIGCRQRRRRTGLENLCWATLPVSLRLTSRGILLTVSLCVTSTVAATRLHSSLISPSPNPPLLHSPRLHIAASSAQQAGWNGETAGKQLSYFTRRGRAVNIWGTNWIIITLTPLCPSFFFCSAVQLDSCGTQDSGHPEHQDGALRRHEQRGLPLHLGTVSVHFAERLCCFSHPLAQCHYASPEWKSAAPLPLLYALVLSWLNTVYRQSVTVPHAFLMQLWCAAGVGVMQFVWHRCGPVGAVSTQRCAAI